MYFWPLVCAGPTLSWTDYLQQERSYQDRLQTDKLNGMRVTQRPDDTEIRFQTHHEILTLIYILRSDASAGTKQRALEILAAATASTSAKAVRLEELEKVLVDADDTDEMPAQELERIEAQKRKDLDEKIRLFEF